MTACLWSVAQSCMLYTSTIHVLCQAPSTAAYEPWHNAIKTQNLFRGQPMNFGCHTHRARHQLVELQLQNRIAESQIVHVLVRKGVVVVEEGRRKVLCSHRQMAYKGPSRLSKGGRMPGSMVAYITAKCGIWPLYLWLGHAQDRSLAIASIRMIWTSTPFIVCADVKACAMHSPPCWQRWQRTVRQQLQRRSCSSQRCTQQTVHCKRCAGSGSSAGRLALDI